jgi:serine/threonine protein kinase
MTINDRYIVDLETSKDVIGRGGQSIVYKGTDKALKSDIALKVYTLHESTSTDALVKEFEQIESYSHPNIIGYLDWAVFSYKKKVHFAVIMNYASSGTLWEYQNNITSDTLKNIHDIFGGILEGLKFIHAKGVYHRDLKPSNVLLSKDAKHNSINSIVTDFLFSSNLTVNTQKVITAKFTRTFGTIEYMAPELLGSDNKFVGAMTDIWSFGVLLYEFFKGEVPFGARGLQDYRKVVENILEKTVDISGIPKPYDTIVDLCLDKDMTTRINDANVLLDVIKQHKLRQGDGSDVMIHIGKTTQDNLNLDDMPSSIAAFPNVHEHDQHTAFKTMIIGVDIPSFRHMQSHVSPSYFPPSPQFQGSPTVFADFQKLKEVEFYPLPLAAASPLSSEALTLNSKDALFELIAEDEIDKCFGELAKIKQVFEHDCYKKFTLLRGEWSRIKKQEMLNLLEFSTVSIETNKIRYRLFDFIHVLSL